MTTTMDKQTRDKIIHRCEILQYMGDSAICSDYDQIPPDELMKDYGWVLEKAHDDLDKFKIQCVITDD